MWLNHVKIYTNYLKYIERKGSYYKFESDIIKHILGRLIKYGVYSVIFRMIAANSYNISAIPRTIFIDKDGYIVQDNPAGVITKEELESQIKLLLKWLSHRNSKKMKL